ncbi:hypothetical protein NHX12_003556 [Muraenolepis orangiensis]|uniref:SH3 domain-containing protein n=1 Tax=Muraenolepis orangiensis TaxID=630683 RepID=A0A9Q0DZ08_9TELE|nr:hypothetical protein NHX12_003556 [Muraenolepis orangiensis]
MWSWSSVTMDTRRPKRPTTLALFPPRAQPRSQDTINNNSLGKKESWKDGRSSSPHITAAGPPPSPPAPPLGEEAEQRQTVTRPRVLRQTHSPDCRETDSKPPPTGPYQVHRGSRGAGKANNIFTSQNICVASMVVPRTPVAPRKQRPKDPERTQDKTGSRDIKGSQDKTWSRDIRGSQDKTGSRDIKGSQDKTWSRDNRGSQDKTWSRYNRGSQDKTGSRDNRGSQDKTGSRDNRGSQDKRQRQQEEQRRIEAAVQNDARNQISPTALSRSNSESGSNRMSISSDIEGPPSDPLCPAAVPPDRTNTDIREEDGEGEATGPAAGAHNGNCEPERESKGPETLGGLSEAGKQRHAETDCDNSGGITAVATKDPPSGLSYDRIEHSLELDMATELAKGRKDEDSDTETVYQQSKMAPVTSHREEEPTGGKSRAPATRKFVNLFVNGNQHTGAESFGVFSCFLDGVEKQQSHRAVYRFVPRHADELYLETDDPVLMLSQSEDLWCQGYNMRTGSSGIFPTYYAARVSKEPNQAPSDAWMDRFSVRFLGSVQVPFHQGNHVLCAAMQKVSVSGLKINVQDKCSSATRGDQCSNFFQLKNISFCGCHPKYNKYFGFISKHPDQQRFACHVVMTDTTSLPLAEAVGRAFQQYYAAHIGYSCPTEDIFID